MELRAEKFDERNRKWEVTPKLKHGKVAAFNNPE
jgi:hypothetical protein